MGCSGWPSSETIRCGSRGRCTYGERCKDYISVTDESLNQLECNVYCDPILYYGDVSVSRVQTRACQPLTGECFVSRSHFTIFRTDVDDVAGL